MRHRSDVRIVSFVAFLVAAFVAGSAGAAEPIEQFRAYVNRVIAVLSDPELQERFSAMSSRGPWRSMSR